MGRRTNGGIAAASANARPRFLRGKPKRADARAGD